MLKLKGSEEDKVEEESVKVGLKRKDALCRSNWRIGVNQIASVSR